jgi:hypothetical protein
MEKRIKLVTTSVRSKLRKPHLSKLAPKWCPNEAPLQMPSTIVALFNSTLLEQLGECQASGTYFISTLLRVTFTQYNTIVVVTIVVGEETSELLPVPLE